MNKDFNLMLGTILSLFGILEVIMRNYIAGILWIAISTAIFTANLSFSRNSLGLKIRDLALASTIILFIVQIVQGLKV